ncbi:hypothetical protein BDD12DRAFT_492739 [Trichophaea hybrida]|nr:hypothetical protein BDD12DRAFT_492739 [Trichophaea hybrida]
MNVSQIRGCINIRLLFKLPLRTRIIQTTLILKTLFKLPSVSQVPPDFQYDCYLEILKKLISSPIVSEITVSTASNGPLVSTGLGLKLWHGEYVGLFILIYGNS